MKQTIYIAGASSGSGKDAVKLFQSKGRNVIATMHNHDKETELKYRYAQLNCPYF